MTVSEYNHNIAPQIGHAKVFIGKLDRLFVESTDTDIARQAKILGWDADMKAFLLRAIDCYESKLLDEVKLFLPQSSLTIEDNE